MSTDVTLFTESKPSVYSLADIYDPDTNPSGKVIPQLDAIVIDRANKGVLYYVMAVGAETNKTTLGRVRIAVVADDASTELVSIVDYGNDVFYVFFDDRTKPIMNLHVDSRLKVYGVTVREYRIIRHPKTPQAEVISLYYQNTGELSGNRIPLALVTPVVRSFTDCHTRAPLVEGEELLIEVYNQYGALCAEVKAFARPSVILNEDLSTVPIITKMTLHCAQTRSNGEFYIFENQDVDSLNIYARLHYDTGAVRDVDIDGTKCIIYGLTDFIASYQGLRQDLVVKYLLSAGEDVGQLTPGNYQTHLIAEASLVVVPNEVAAGVKISVIPRWNAGQNQYILRYYLYFHDRDDVKDVTGLVTLDIGSQFKGDAYGVRQILTMQLDLGKVDPATYLEGTTYQQTLVIVLRPVTLLERYTISSGTQSPYTYGIDSSQARRPILKYDTTLQQYFVPSEVFQNKDAFLRSFYTLADPPYDISTETLPPVPTHFLVRDILTGASIVDDLIEIENYDAAFSITGMGGNARYVGTNVLVEFVQKINETQSLILFGVPVDVYESTSGYQGPRTI